MTLLPKEALPSEPVLHSARQPSGSALATRPEPHWTTQPGEAWGHWWYNALGGNDSPDEEPASARAVRPTDDDCFMIPVGRIGGPLGQFWAFGDPRHDKDFPEH